MPGFLGRKVILRWGSDSPPAQLLGVREKGISLAGEAVDITSDDSDGWRELLEEAGENQVTISVSGVTKDDVLKVAWFAEERMGPAEIEYPDGGIVSGDFFLASYNETGTYNDATTFEAELQSSGVIAYIPGP